MVLKEGFERAGVILCATAVWSQKAPGHKETLPLITPAEGNAQCSASLCDRKQGPVILLFRVLSIPFRQIVSYLLYSIRPKCDHLFKITYSLHTKGYVTY